MSRSSQRGKYHTMGNESSSHSEQDYTSNDEQDILFSDEEHTLINGEQNYASGGTNAAHNMTYSETVLQTLHEMQQSGEGTDVVLESGTESVSCHRAVLMAASPYFRELFASDSEEANQGIIQVHEVDPTVLHTVVTFMYTGKCDINFKNAENIIKASFHLQMVSALTSCDRALSEMVDHNTCIELYKQSSISKLHQTRDVAAACIAFHFREKSMSEEFMQLGLDEVTEILDRDDVDVENEDYVFEVVMQWINTNMAERKQYLVQLIQHVRFKFCTASFFRKNVLSVLMREKECAELVTEACKHHMDDEYDEHEEEPLPETLPRDHYGQRIPRPDIDEHGAREQLLCVDRAPTKWKCISFNKDTNDWEQITEMPLKTTDASACLVPQGLLITGFPTTGKDGKLCFIYDFQRKTWRKFHSLEEFRANHASVYHNGRVYVIGGGSKNGTSAEVCKMNDNKGWQMITPVPDGFQSPMAASCKKNLYVLGGLYANHTWSRKVHTLNHFWGVWEEKAQMPVEIHGGTAASYNDILYIVGSHPTLCCMSYNPNTNAWTSLSKPTKSHGFAQCTIWKGRILLGGTPCQKPIGNTGRTGSPFNPVSNAAGCQHCFSNNPPQLGLQQRQPQHHRNDYMIQEYNPDTDSWATLDIHIPLGTVCPIFLNLKQ